MTKLALCSTVVRFWDCFWLLLLFNRKQRNGRYVKERKLVIMRNKSQKTIVKSKKSKKNERTSWSSLKSTMMIEMI